MKSKLTEETIRQLTPGAEFYGVSKNEFIDSWIFCGLHPYAKGKVGIIVYHTSNVKTLKMITTHYSSGKIYDYFISTEYYTDYEEAKKRFIEVKEADLEDIRRIYRPD